MNVCRQPVVLCCNKPMESKRGEKWQWTVPGAEIASLHASLWKKRHLLKLYFSDGRSGIIHAANNTLGKPNYLPLLTTLRYWEITFLPPLEATKTWMWTSCSAALNATSRRNISQADFCFKEFLEDIYFLTNLKMVLIVLWPAICWPWGAMNIFAKDVAVTQCRPMSSLAQPAVQLRKHVFPALTERGVYT